MPLAVKEALLRFLFEEMKISRLCLLPKALAIARLFETSNCIVVDSGATNTYVWVVLDGRVEEERTKTVAVGGWHLAQFLKQALAWKESGREIAAGVRIIMRERLNFGQFPNRCIWTIPTRQFSLVLSFLAFLPSNFALQALPENLHPLDSPLKVNETTQLDN